jgi:hypothetical protein
MSLYKRAYARAVNDELIRLGLVRYPTKLAADEIADAVGDQMAQDPGAPAPEGMAAEPVSPETAAEVAATLVESANKLIEETGAAGMAEEGAPPMPEEEALKTSAATDLDTRAHNQGYAVMVKAAEEAKHAMGSTIAGGDKGNDLLDAKATTGEGSLEANRRPEGYAVKGEDGVGQTDHGAGRGTGVVGDETVPAPDAPGASDSGSNTAVQQSKMGSSLREVIRKVAMMGSTIEGGDKGNTLDQAAAVTGEGALEQMRRPEGYAENMLAATDLPVTPAATVGTEQPHPDQPGASPAGAVPGAAGNSVVEHSNESKTGSDDNPFMVLFKKTASEVASFLPTNISEDQKIAHIRQMMGMNDGERNEYVGMLHKHAGATDDQAVEVAQKHAEHARTRREKYSGYTGHQRTDRTRTNQKQAGELPPALAAAMGDKDEKKDDDKKDKKPEMKGEEMPYPAEDKKDEKKEGADLLSRIRSISQSVRA